MLLLPYYLAPMYLVDFTFLISLLSFFSRWVLAWDAPRSIYPSLDLPALKTKHNAGSSANVISFISHGRLLVLSHGSYRVFSIWKFFFATSAMPHSLTYDECVSCTKELDPKSMKGLFRRGLARIIFQTHPALGRAAWRPRP